MSAAERMRIRDEIMRAYLEESCRRSDVPVRITDPTTVARAADLLRGDGNGAR